MKYAHIEKDTNKLLGWYADDIHGTWVDPVYKEKVIQEEEKDEDNNIIKEKITENVLVEDGYWDTSKIPTPNIKVDEEDWQEAININANCYEDGKFIVKDFRTDEEIAQQDLQAKINEAKNYLASTDYKMTVDYFATLDKVTQDELIAERQKAREFIRANS